MILIAHRGNIEGIEDGENNPERIVRVLGMGYDCEIDVRYRRGQWWLGHNKPEYRVPESFLLQPGLWLHMKNLDALEAAPNGTNHFWHETDPYTLTSHGFVWAHPTSPLGRTCIAVLPELTMTHRTAANLKVRGMCSDYIRSILRYRKS